MIPETALQRSQRARTWSLESPITEVTNGTAPAFFVGVIRYARATLRLGPATLPHPYSSEFCRSRFCMFVLSLPGLRGDESRQKQHHQIRPVVHFRLPSDRTIGGE